MTSSTAILRTSLSLAEAIEVKTTKQNKFEIDQALFDDILKLITKIYELKLAHDESNSEKLTVPQSISEAYWIINNVGPFSPQSSREKYGLTLDEIEEFKTSYQLVDSLYFTDEERLTLEEYKLAFMKKMQRYLEEKYDSKLTEALPIQQTSRYSRPLFYLLMGIDFAPMTIDGIVYAKNALDFLPFVVSPLVATSIGLLLTFFELTISYAFAAPILKQRLGIPDTQPKCLPTIYQEQMESTQKINEILTHFNKVHAMKLVNYERYAIADTEFNQSIINTRNNFPEFKESSGLTITRYAITGINMVNNASGVIFMAKNFLLMLAPTMTLISPAGISIIALMLAGQLASRYIYQSSSLFLMMNPMAEQYEQTKQKLNSFQPKSPSELNEALAIKKLSQ